MRYLYKILLAIFVLTGCEKKPTPVLNNIDFYLGDSYYSISGKAQRTRDHKTISLKISSEGSSNIALSILINEYTDAFHYKLIKDYTLYTHDNVKFSYISSGYYESADGFLNVRSDNDKTIKGDFEFTAQNVFDSTDFITVKDGYFEIDYSESIAIERKY